jgi:hypothetical protein
VTSGLTFADNARALLRLGYGAAYAAGKQDATADIIPTVFFPDDTGDEQDDTGDDDPTYESDEDDTEDDADNWPDETDDAAQTAAVDEQADLMEDSLLAFGALLIGGYASVEQLDAWLGTYASTLNPLYEVGFHDGVQDAVQGKGEVTQATWVSEDDPATCDDCKALNGMTWVGDEIDAAMPHPGDSEFGGRTACGPNCRCSIDYLILPADQATYSWGGYDDDVQEFSTADLLKVWSILRMLN